MDELLASGFNSPVDMTLEPGGGTMLVSELNGGKIDRIDLTAHQVSVLATPGGNPEGLAYDCDGRLFANLGVRSDGATKYVAELDPVTGATLRVSPMLNFLDGLVYDTFSGKLYATTFFSNGLYAIDPDNLSNVTPLFFGRIPGADGLTSDGQGNIFIAARGDFHVYHYNIPGDAVTRRDDIGFISGMDDLAPPPVCEGTGPIQPGQTATIGFWHNRNGQALINGFNGGPNSTALSAWLATNFPNLYGAGAGTNNLTGETNAQVAAFYEGLFAEHGPKLDAQVLGTALNVYATTASLGGAAGVQYGFTVTVAGLGGSNFDVGAGGAAFGVPDDTTLTVFQILRAANRRAVNGVLYNGDPALRDLAIVVFDGINQAGDIG
jgi:hypothetical protein